MPRRTLNQIEQIIFMRSNSISDGDCMIWQLAVMPDGYGSVKWNGRRWQAHRLMYLLCNDLELDDKILALHKACCHSRACINPNHIYGGTQKENIQDAIKAGKHFSQNPRNREPKQHPAVKTQEQMEQIRQLGLSNKGKNDREI